MEIKCEGCTRLETRRKKTTGQAEEKVDKRTQNQNFRILGVDNLEELANNREE